MDKEISTNLPNANKGENSKASNKGVGAIHEDQKKKKTLDKVDQASWESFPASDSPGWGP